LPLFLYNYILLSCTPNIPFSFLFWVCYNESLNRFFLFAVISKRMLVKGGKLLFCLYVEWILRKSHQWENESS
jgi:hypothetical protein